MSRVETAGRVYDRGYRPYDGPLGGRRQCQAALWRASIRRAMGFRRPWRQRIVQWALLGIVSVPAIVNVGVAYLTRNSSSEQIEIITYREYVGVSSALLVFVAITAPDVICPDRRNRVLPLVFARPITGRDYVVAKVGAIWTIVFAFGFIPHVVLYVGQLFVSDGALDYLRDHLDVLWKVPVSVALLALYYAVLALALASMTTKRLIAAASFLILLLVSSVVSGILVGPSDEFDVSTSGWAVLNLLAVPLHVRDVVFLGHVDPDGPLAGIANGGLLAAGVYATVTAISALVLVRRYRWVEA